MPMITRRRVLQGVAGTVAGLSLVAGYGSAGEPMSAPRVTTYGLTPDAWPKGLELSIAVVADVHACKPYMPASRVHEICQQTNALRADLIVLLGDYVTGHRFITGHVAEQAWAEALAVLRAPLGVHAVLGNHDWWRDPVAQRAGKGPIVARRELERAGIPVYENDVVRLTKDGRPFWLAGLGDQMAFLDPSRSTADWWKGVDDLPDTLAKVTDDAPVVLLAHEPDIFPSVGERVAVTLSGHTHGGQIRMFGHGLFVPSQYGNRYAYGHVVEHGRHLIVSGGLGCSTLPVRIGAPPEIVLIRLGGGS